LPTLLKQIKPSKQPEYRNNVKKGAPVGNLEYVGDYLIMHPTERFKDLASFVQYVESTILHMDKATRRYLNRLEYRGKECVVFENTPQLVKAKAHFKYGGRHPKRFT